MSIHDELANLAAKLRVGKRGIHATATIVPFTRALADTVGPILQDPTGKLAGELNSMWDLIKSSPTPARAVFVIKRNTSNSAWADIWQFQLLIIIVQGFSTVRRRIPPRDRRLKMGRLDQVIAAARHAWDEYVKLHGARTVIDHMIEAVAYLLDTLPRGLALDERRVVLDGVRIDRKLTSKEHVFLTLLVDKNGETVSSREFRDREIPRPGQLKHRLVQKTEFQFLDGYVIPDSGGYRLRRA